MAASGPGSAGLEIQAPRTGIHISDTTRTESEEKYHSLNVRIVVLSFDLVVDRHMEVGLEHDPLPVPGRHVEAVVVPAGLTPDLHPPAPLPHHSAPSTEGESHSIGPGPVPLLHVGRQLGLPPRLLNEEQGEEDDNGYDGEAQSAGGYKIVSGDVVSIMSLLTVPGDGRDGRLRAVVGNIEKHHPHKPGEGSHHEEHHHHHGAALVVLDGPVSSPQDGVEVLTTHYRLRFVTQSKPPATVCPLGRG